VVAFFVLTVFLVATFVTFFFGAGEIVFFGAFDHARFCGENRDGIGMITI